MSNPTNETLNAAYKADEVLAHVVDKISNAEVINEPFPHFYIEEVFPEDFYNKLLETLPGGALYKKWTDVGRVKEKQYSRRIQWYLEEEWMMDFPEEVRTFWLKFGDWFLGKELADTSMKKFEPTLTERFEGGTDSWPEVFPQAIFLRHQADYYIGPHTDIPSKVVNILFYLPQDNNAEHIGTAVYVPEEEGFTDPGTKHYGFEGFNLLKTMPYKRNCAFAFVKTDNSWHGVEPLTENDSALSTRDAIQYMVYDTPMRAPRKDRSELK